MYICYICISIVNYSIFYAAVCDMPECKHGYCESPDECKCMDGWEGDACDTGKPSLCYDDCMPTENVLGNRLLPDRHSTVISLYSYMQCRLCEWHL